MTALIPIDADDMERIAHKYNLEIEVGERDARLTVDGITFVAKLPAVTS